MVNPADLQSRGSGGAPWVTVAKTGVPRVCKLLSGRYQPAGVR